MKKSTGVILVLIIILLLGVIGVGGYFLIKGNNDTNKEIGELKNEVANLRKNAENTSYNSNMTSNLSNDTENTSNQSVTNNTTTAQTSSTANTENKVKTIYYNYIKANDEKNTDEKLLEYRVDEVKILSDSEKKSILEFDGGQYYKETDTLAEVTYSVKPQDVNSTNWIAGNGTKSGDWIINKTACVCIRNGEVVNSGTSW